MLLKILFTTQKEKLFALLRDRLGNSGSFETMKRTDRIDEFGLNILFRSSNSRIQKTVSWRAICSCPDQIHFVKKTFSIRFIVRFFSVWRMSFRFILDCLKEFWDTEETCESENTPKQFDNKSQKAKDRLGREGEKAAESYLIHQGYKILYRNYKFTSCEFDLIATPPQSKEIVFIEVKTRRTRSCGEPYESVDSRRIGKLLTASKEFIRWRKLKNPQIRFDVISILWPWKQDPQINHLINFFDGDGNVFY